MTWNSITVQPLLTLQPSGFRQPGHKNHSCQSHRTCGQQRFPSPCPGKGSPGITFHVRAQVVAHFAQDEVDVLLRGDGVRGDVRGAVRGPCDRHLLPGQEEDHSAVAGGRVQQPHVVRAEREEGPGSQQEQGGQHQGSDPAPQQPGKDWHTTAVLR